jgi:SAM-dependent methyltransferase
MDWDAGNYERIAAQLLAAARAVVDHAAPLAGERVLDIGCGTGSAAILAAERGARVTGVDPSPRLLDLARADAAARGLDIAVLAGEAAALPVPDGSADAIVSSFGVIFAPDARAAALEMARVAAPAARIVLSTWLPGGALGDAMRLRREATEAAGVPGGPPPFPWHEEPALEDLFAGLGFAAAVEERTLAFTASSAAEFLEGELRDHPGWIAARRALEPRGEMEGLRERVLVVLEAGNEDPRAFALTSSYVIVTAARTRTPAQRRRRSLR